MKPADRRQCSANRSRGHAIRISALVQAADNFDETVSDKWTSAENIRASVA